MIIIDFLNLLGALLLSYESNSWLKKTGPGCNRYTNIYTDLVKSFNSLVHNCDVSNDLVEHS